MSVGSGWRSLITPNEPFLEKIEIFLDTFTFHHMLHWCCSCKTTNKPVLLSCCLLLVFKTTID
jgi:hypothetical protein